MTHYIHVEHSFKTKIPKYSPFASNLESVLPFTKGEYLEIFVLNECCT
jgi:hypothetical protein